MCARRESQSDRLRETEREREREREREYEKEGYVYVDVEEEEEKNHVGDVVKQRAADKASRLADSITAAPSHALLSDRTRAPTGFEDTCTAEPHDLGDKREL